LKREAIEPIVERNKQALKAALNIRDGNKVYAMLKDMKPNTSFTFPDGTEVLANDVVDPPRPGRKVVVSEMLYCTYEQHMVHIISHMFCFVTQLLFLS
jgi:hypothetical protein